MARRRRRKKTIAVPRVSPKPKSFSSQLGLAEKRLANDKALRDKNRALGKPVRVGNIDKNLDVNTDLRRTNSMLFDAADAFGEVGDDFAQKYPELTKSIGVNHAGRFQANPSSISYVDPNNPQSSRNGPVEVGVTAPTSAKALQLAKDQLRSTRPEEQAPDALGAFDKMYGAARNNRSNTPRIATDIKVIRPTPENPTGKNLSGREMLRRKLFLSGSGTGSSVKDKELRAQIASEQARADQIAYKEAAHEQARADQIAYKEAAQKESDDEKAFIASESTKEIAGRSDVANINAGGKLGVAEADRIAKNEVVDKQIQAKSDELVAQGLAIGTPQFNERLKAEFNEKRKLAAAANDYAQELEAFRSLNRIAEKSLTTVEEFSIDDDGEKTTTTITPGVVTPSAESSVGDEGGPSPDTDGDGMLNAEERATRDAEVQFINQAILNGIDGHPLNESETKRAMARLAVLRKLK